MPYAFLPMQRACAGFAFHCYFCNYSFTVSVLTMGPKKDNASDSKHNIVIMEDKLNMIKRHFLMA